MIFGSLPPVRTRPTTYDMDLRRIDSSLLNITFFSFLGSGKQQQQIAGYHLAWARSPDGAISIVDTFTLTMRPDRAAVNKGLVFYNLFISAINDFEPPSQHRHVRGKNPNTIAFRAEFMRAFHLGYVNQHTPDHATLSDSSVSDLFLYLWGRSVSFRKHFSAVLNLDIYGRDNMLDLVY